MGRINTGRVVMGGVLAGLIIDVGEMIGSFVFEGQYARMTAELGLGSPTSAAIAVFMAMGFVLGIVLVWLYAAVRPRLGAGPKTAVIVGLVFWLIAYFIPLLSEHLMGMVPPAMVVTASLWGVVEVCVAALAGGWVYKEEGAAA